MPSLKKRKRSKRALYWIERRKVKRKLATREPNIIDNLPESLLLQEIFSKLRNPKHLTVCKSVSKRWNSMISSSFQHNVSLALILNTEPHNATNDVCLEDWKGFKLSNYIHPAEVDSPICVLASCKDVLLFTRPLSKELYIVNPVTMQWTRLPDVDGEVATSRLPFGLIGNGTKGLYHVVQLQSSRPSGFFIFLFVSMFGAWRFTHVKHPPWSKYGWCPTQYQALVFKGALHWLGEDGPVMAYNPITFTDLPMLQENWTTSSTQHNMSELLFRLRKNQKTRERIVSPQTLCCHPYNPLLVYFFLPESIVSLDVATKKLQIITRLSKRGRDGVYWNQYDKVIPMTMHLDPSLVPDHGHVLQPRRKFFKFRSY